MEDSLKKQADEFVNTFLSGNQCRSVEARNRDLPEAVWNIIFDEYPDFREYLVWCKKVPLSVLKKLAKVEDPKIRHLVSTKRKIDRELFEMLADDSDPSVRASVARHAKIPADLLKKLRHDGDDWVRERANSNARIN